MQARSVGVAVALAVVLAGTVGCSHRRPAFRPSPTFVVPESGLSEEEFRWLEGHCPGGAPKPLATINHGPVTVISRRGYALLHSAIDKIPRWVCEGVTFEQLQGSLDRSDAFKPDPKLAPGERAELRDYKGSGFDRGHMAPAGNQTVDPVLKAETFFLSNMAPQVGRQFNQGAWRILEEWARGRVTADTKIYIITGGFFYDPKEDDPATADGVIDYQTIGNGAVAVPTHFYKIVARQDDAGDWDAIAFVMANRKYPNEQAFQASVKPIRWIEERAALDFFPDLDPVSQDRIELAPPTLWP